MWKFKSWKGKDKYLFLLSVGVMLCILAFPAERLSGMRGITGEQNADTQQKEEKTDAENVHAEVGYEKQLEKRVEEILSHVDGAWNISAIREQDWV